jgi:hypothetical protein
MSLRITQFKCMHFLAPKYEQIYKLNPQLYLFNVKNYYSTI